MKLSSIIGEGRINLRLVVLPGRSLALAGLLGVCLSFWDEAKAESTNATRQVEILGGQFKLDPVQIPMIGSQQAPQLIVALLDYTCQGCRILHMQLQEAIHVFGDQLAVVYLPAPLDGACNPVVKEIYPEHTNGCQYAHLALAIWQVDRAAFPGFEQWLWAQPPFAPAEEARRFAAHWSAGLTNQPVINERVEAQLQQGIGIYQVLHRQLGRHAMPLLLVGTNVNMGSFRSTEDLCRLLQQQLSLKPASDQKGDAHPKPR
jgi:hypothetical protein